MRRNVFKLCDVPCGARGARQASGRACGERSSLRFFGISPHPVECDPFTPQSFASCVVALSNRRTLTPKKKPPRIPKTNIRRAKGREPLRKTPSSASRTALPWAASRTSLAPSRRRCTRCAAAARLRKLRQSASRSLRSPSMRSLLSRRSSNAEGKYLRRIVLESCGEKKTCVTWVRRIFAHSHSFPFRPKQLRRRRRRGRRARRGQVLRRRGGKGLPTRTETRRAGDDELGTSIFNSNAVFNFVARVPVPFLMRRTHPITTNKTPQIAPRQEMRGRRGRGRGNFEGRGRGRGGDSGGRGGGGRWGGRGRGRAPNFYFQPPPYGCPMQQPYAVPPPQQPFYPGGHPGWCLFFVLLTVFVRLSLA